MQTGTKLSLFAHIVLILLIIFGLPSSQKEAEPLDLSATDLRIVTEEELAALQPAAPEPGAEEVIEPEEAEPAPSVEEQAPEPPPQDEPLPNPVQAEVNQPSQAQIASEDRLGEISPEPLPDAPPPPPPARRIADRVIESDTLDRSPLPEPAVAPLPAPEEPVETPPEPVQDATAPPEQTTEIVTEADLQRRPEAPVASRRPAGRPADFTQEIAKRQQAAQEAEAQAQDDEIAALLAAAQAEASAASTSATASPLTSGDLQGLVLAVQSCWNVPIGVRYAADLQVVLRVEFDERGRLVSEPRLVDSSGSDPTAAPQAFEAARRALLQCQPYALPPEKYDQWKILDVAFNPEQMVLR